jgi:hypothetical protein
VSGARHVATAHGCFIDFEVQIIDQSLHRGGIGDKIGGTGVEFGFQDGHSGFALFRLLNLNNLQF